MDFCAKLKSYTFGYLEQMSLTIRTQYLNKFRALGNFLEVFQNFQILNTECLERVRVFFKIRNSLRRIFGC